MLNWIRKQLRKEDGLTLIELIVVVAIIAILAFTITPRVLDALDNSKKNGARSVANELHSAMERYYANEAVSASGKYPIPVAATTDKFVDLRGQLGTKTLGLTSSSANVFTDFKFTGNTTTDGSNYCVSFIAKDKATTIFRITPAGVEEEDATATPAVSPAECS